jgi:SAM-dependent methyltransferase
MPDYIEVVYNEKVRPKTEYPARLASYLFSRYNMQPGQKFLEPGCGRGEFLRQFHALGLDVQGIDASPVAGKFLPEVEIRICDLEREKTTYESDYFDIIYSKSLLEHFHHPETFIKEMYRILKPGGLILTLVPDWETNWRIYFDDFSHRSPFSRNGLEDFLKIHEFEDVRVESFYQLPVNWKFPILNYLSAILAPFAPRRTKFKYLFFSRYTLLLSSARKPL